jgi:Flp pilus assembly pilin Flp
LGTDCPMRALKREDGQTIVEYALVLGGISLVMITLLIVAGLVPVFEALIDDIEAAIDFP